MGTKGILKAILDESSVDKTAYKNYQTTGILELKSFDEIFIAYLDPNDPNSIGTNTKNPKYTATNANWIIIREHVWDSLLKGSPKTMQQDIFKKLDKNNIAAEAKEISKVSVNGLDFRNFSLLEGVVF